MKTRPCAPPTARLHVRQRCKATRLPSGDRRGFLHAKSITVTIINLSCCFSVPPSLPTLLNANDSHFLFWKMDVLCRVYLRFCVKEKRQQNKAIGKVITSVWRRCVPGVKMVSSCLGQWEPDAMQMCSWAPTVKVISIVITLFDFSSISCLLLSTLLPILDHVQLRNAWGEGESDVWER